MARYIDMDKYPDMYPAEPDDMVSDAFSAGYYSCLKIIKEMQAEDVAPVVHAHWIEDHGDIVCSNCGARYSDEIVFMSRDKDVYDLPHCPECGAKMDEEMEEWPI